LLAHPELAQKLDSITSSPAGLLIIVASIASVGLLMLAVLRASEIKLSLGRLKVTFRFPRSKPPSSPRRNTSP
jgi:hypothetical protein